MEDSPEKQIIKCENDLAQVNELLRASPDDESLLKLKSDIEELLELTRQSLSNKIVSNEITASKTTPNILEKALEAAVGTSVGIESDQKLLKSSMDEQDAEEFTTESNRSTEFPDGDDTLESPKKKAKKVKEFEIPSHLVPRDTDTEGERNRKRRAIKALKNKHREKRKEVESEKKQKSWQSFQKKKKLGNDKSIFSTSKDGDAKVGVVSAVGRQVVAQGVERKRQKKL